MRSQTLIETAADAAGQGWSIRRITIVSIAWTWGVYLALIATRLAIIRFHPEAALLGRHCLIAVAGAAITWCVHILLRRLRHVPIVSRIGAAMIVGLPAAGALSLINYGALYMIAPEAIWPARVLAGITLNGVIARTLPDMYFLLISWATLYSSVTSALESREAQRRAAILQAEIHETRLKALRYQLNPHFLFNALNSLSAVVMLDDRERAEHVIQAMSTFLRSTLEEGDMTDTTLAKELEVQRQYLEIEQIRFGERFRVIWSVPDELGAAELPPLLLQPLFENVLRHAVAPVSATITMTVTAHTETDGLHVAIEDDGRGDGVPGGTRIGLSNVASRLKMRYGDAGRCAYGRGPDGGFRVEVVLPLQLRAVGA